MFCHAKYMLNNDILFLSIKDLGSNPSAVESVFFPQKDFQIL